MAGKSEEFASQYESGKSEFIAGWQKYISFRSVSADPAFREELLNCATWLRDQLGSFGMEAILLPTAAAPVVLAEKIINPSLPTVLFYGHYDVQPPDPLDKWESDPFTGVLKGERMYARGANDDKGQVWPVLCAVRTLISTGKLGCNLKVLIEGGEEIGSTALAEKLPAWRERLKADVLLVCDTEAYAVDVPAITLGLRGVIHMEAWLHGASSDLHSGLHGGLIRNPAEELCRLVAALHTADGKVAVPGFYDGVQPPSDQERAFIAEQAFDIEAYRTKMGVYPDGGESGFPPLERLAFRPALSVNGFHSGYGGPGSKTIIPGEAQVKITVRTVAGQDSEKLMRSVEEFLRARVPSSLSMRFEGGVGGAALRVSPTAAHVSAARALLEQVSGVAPKLVWNGASVPIVAKIVEETGAHPLLVGWGLPEDRIHGPNESFRLSHFRLAYMFAAAMLSSGKVR